jgi:subtilase family serine protease
MDVVGLGRRCRQVVATAGLVVLVGSTGASAAFAQTAVPDAQSSVAAHRTGPGFQEHHEFRGSEEHIDVNVCSTAVTPNSAHCDARVRTDSHAAAQRPARPGLMRPEGVFGANATVGNNGAYDPSYLQSAYNLMSAINAGAGAHQAVAIVDALDSPTAQDDLNTYRSFFGLPSLPTCSTWPSTTACFRKVNQTGGVGPYPQADSGWALEIALDLEMVSAMCPNCSILLVEASTNTYSDLGAAVNEAVLLGANAVSNSYGGAEWSGEAGFDLAYTHPGVAITASSGDAGYGTEYPAASPFVTAVGGTSLTQATSGGTRDGSETAWGSAGSGCSAFEPKPVWQKDTICTNRTVADVSAVADPNTGVWVYNGGSWYILGGTSAAAPIVASVYALAGNGLGSGLQLNATPYSHASSLFDTTSGSNGSCGGTYLCTGVAGYDGPTGLGSPNGVAAFKNVVALPADFSLKAANASPTLVRGGANVSDTLTLTAANGYHSSVQLSVAGVPAGVTASFSANAVTPSGTSKLTLHAAKSAAAGKYPLTVTARGADGKVHTQNLQVTVQ